MAGRVASLEGSALNLSALREDGRAELIDLLSSLTGRKCLVLDSVLAGLLNHVLPEGSRLLKEKGVVYVRELTTNTSGGNNDLGVFINPQGEVDPPDHIIYLVRPSLPYMKVIANHIAARTKAGVPFDYRYQVYFVPQRSRLCEQVLRDEGVLHRIDVGDYPLDLIPLDSDLLSLELDGAGPPLRPESGAMGGCWAADSGGTVGTGVTAVARSICRLQTMYGAIPNIKAQGYLSEAALKRAMRVRREEWDLKDGATQPQPEIDTLILLDRSVDLITPFVTPLTYEGLIDELIGIKNGYVKVDATIAEPENINKGDENNVNKNNNRVQQQQEKGKLVALALNSNDSLYRMIRDLNVEQLGPFLQGKAKEIRESYLAFRRTKDHSLTEIHDFVKRIPGLTQTYKSLNQHINIAELVKATTDSADFRRKWQIERSALEGEASFDAVDDLINEDAPFSAVIRLLCLLSVTRGGILSSRYDTLRRDIVQAYGYEATHKLGALEAAGILRKVGAGIGGMGWLVDAAAANPWTSIKRSSLRVMSNDMSSEPTDMRYVSSGYAPMSVRLVEVALTSGWLYSNNPSQDITSILKLLPGPTIEFTQGTEPLDLAAAMAKYQDTAPSENIQQAQKDQKPKKKVAIVYYIGGVTFMELAALRWLSSQKHWPYEIIVATTKLINGDTFISSLTPGYDNCLVKTQQS